MKLARSASRNEVRLGAALEVSGDGGDAALQFSERGRAPLGLLLVGSEIQARWPLALQFGSSFPWTVGDVVSHQS